MFCKARGKAATGGVSYRFLEEDLIYSAWVRSWIHRQSRGEGPGEEVNRLPVIRPVEDD